MRVLVLIFILAFVSSSPAAADKLGESVPVSGWKPLRLQKPQLKFQKKKLWNLVALPVYLFLEINIHEGSHAVAAVAVGGKVVSYKPYPHMAWGGFFWGSVSTKGNYSKADEAFFYLAPYMTDAVIFTSVDLFLGYRVISPESTAGLIVYTVGMVAPWINFMYNVNNPRSASDFTCFARVIGINRWALSAVGNVIAVFAAWRLWVRGRDVLFSAVPAKETPDRITFAPLVGGVNGAMMGFKF